MQTILSNERLKTGALKVGDDWPGVFIRGDDALAYASILKHSKAKGVQGLTAVLNSCFQVRAD